MGAEVIKLEGPAGDNSRGTAFRPGTVSYLHALNNAGKKGITMDLKTERGRAILKELVKHVDVLIENFVAGTMEKWGLAYEVLRAVNPRLIYASVTGFGRDSVYRDAHAADMTIQAMSGGMAATGLPGQPPIKAAPFVIDTATPVYLTVGILGALLARRETGHGQLVEVAMRDAAVCIPMNLYTIYYNTGRVPKTIGNRAPGASPSSSYRTSDGYVYIYVASDRDFEGLLRVMGREDLIRVDRFASRRKRVACWKELDEMVESWTASRTRKEVFDQLLQVDVPCGMVLDLEEVLNDEDLNKRGVFTQIEQPGIGTMKLTNSPIRFDGSPQPLGQAPLFGEHNEEVYIRLLGYSQEEFEGLKREGVIPTSNERR
jgi:formyl-CoA transferase